MPLEHVIEHLWPGREVRAEKLGGGLTNHNFKVTVDGERFVVRVAGRDTELLGIDRRSEHGAALVAAEIGVGPEVVAFVESENSLVTRFVEGSPVDEQAIREPETIARVARALRAIHDGPTVPGRFDSFRVVEAYRDTVAAHGRPEPAAFARAKAVADRIEATLGEREERPCHNDLLTANFIADGDRIWIVDWEYAGMGDPFFDLANFSVNNGLDEDGDRALLAAYGADDVARLTLMRFMSDFREAMWGAVQQAVSALDFDFVAYADEHFARLDATAASARFRDALAYVTQAQPSQ
ncbi:MAG TPA: choline/ethanolamine kinase family protein [Gaiellaceae bacterium]|nr:choline/ethanolamine kinase family protein [Gaiellaceae bacterium]